MGGKNLVLNIITNSFHDVMELFGCSTSNLLASPVNEGGNHWSWIKFGDTILNDKGIHTYSKLLICSWGSSCSNPPQIPVDCRRCNVVLLSLNIAFPSSCSMKLALILTHFRRFIGTINSIDILMKSTTYLMAYLAAIASVHYHTSYTQTSKSDLKIKLVKL